MKHYLDEMPLYAAGQLSPAEATELEKHLEECPDCQAELIFWQNLAGEIQTENTKISAPADLADRVLKQIHSEDTQLKTRLRPYSAPSRFKTSCLSAFSLLHAQAYLIKREIWSASTSIMALGVIIALISSHAEAISFLAPLVAAASLAALYGPENDPAHELTLAAPTSTWKILLARLSVVSVYNLLLSLLASLAMLLIVPSNLLGMIILGWLAPMAFLSTLALLLSLWIGTGNAIMISYGLWILQYLQISTLFGDWRFSSNLEAFLNAYRNFWQSSSLLLIFSLVLLGITLLSTPHTERGLSQTPA